MKRTQRWLLYEAEDLVIGPVSWYPSVEWAQADIDRLIKSKWWRDRSQVGQVILSETPAKGSGAIRISDTHWRVEFSPRALNSLALAHELTHALVGGTVGGSAEDHEQDHSAHFAGAELALVKRFISADVSRRLKQEFDSLGVKYVDYK